MLSNSSPGYVLRLFARHGGVVIAQRVLSPVDVASVFNGLQQRREGTAPRHDVS
jgi:hypothetical protein